MERDLKREFKLDLFAETREAAEATAKWIRDEGFGAEVGRPASGHTGWKIIISGDPKRVEALSHRLLREMEEESG